MDGHTTSGVHDQLRQLPSDATHMVISIGGNDALGASGVLRQAAGTVGDAFAMIHQVSKRFQSAYREMLSAVLSHRRPTAVCTIYDSVPGLPDAETAALAIFNDVILREVIAHRLPMIDLRLVCTQSSDYSSMSPIEPSSQGGAKIAKVIARLVKAWPETSQASIVFH